MVLILDTLRDWHHLEKRRRVLDVKIPQMKARIEAMRDKLSRDGILSSIVQQTENMDMPRGDDVTDKVGNAVATVLDKTSELERMYVDMVTEREDIENQLTMLEVELAGLSQRHQKVLILYYRDGRGLESIAQELYCHFTRVRAMRIEAERELKRWA